MKCPTVDQDFSHSLGDVEACAHFMSHISCHTELPSLYRSVQALMSSFQYYLVEWNLAKVERLHSPEAGDAGNDLPLEVPKDREGNSRGEKHAVLMP